MPFEVLSPENKRKRVIHEQAGCCLRCGLNEWLDEPIPLEIDHNDGDNQNNARENLEALCPNCHALTPTWRGRNRSRHVTDEMMIEAIRGTQSLRQALIKLGMTPKGGNYDRVTRITDTLIEAEGLTKYQSVLEVSASLQGTLDLGDDMGQVGIEPTIDIS